MAIVALTSSSTESVSLSWALGPGLALTAIEVVGYVALGVGFALLPLVVILGRKRSRSEPGNAGANLKERAPAPWWARIVALLFIVAVVVGQALVVLAFLRELQLIRTEAGGGGSPASAVLDEALAPLGRDLTSLTIALVILTALAVLVVAIATRWRLTSDTPSDGARDRQAVTVRALEVSLDALHREPDPRRAVIAAYVAMERSLAGAGLAREPSEAPIEYLRRVLARMAGRAQDLRTITDLFQIARFSRHPVDEGMRNSAITALERLRSGTGEG